MACTCCSSWKTGPCIDNITRKQIWEENYLTRENLRGVQRSEHFWDFQMTKNSCDCCAVSPKKQLHKFQSLQSLNQIGQTDQSSCHNQTKTNPSFQGICSVHPCVGAPGRCCRDVSTVTTPPREDKSVGPGPRRRVQLPPTPNHRPFIAGSVLTCPKYRPPDWTRNETYASKQRRQESLQKLRKSEEELQLVMQRTKRIPGNSGQWGTEYSRSYKDRGWPKSVSPLTQPSRCVTPKPASLLAFGVGGQEAPRNRGSAQSRVNTGRETPLPRYAVG